MKRLKKKFNIAPAIGYRFMLRGRKYVLKRKYKMAASSGAVLNILEWRSTCENCGEPIIVESHLHIYTLAFRCNYCKVKVWADSPYRRKNQRTRGKGKKPKLRPWRRKPKKIRLTPNAPKPIEIQWSKEELTLDDLL